MILQGFSSFCWSGISRRALFVRFWWFIAVYNHQWLFLFAKPLFYSFFICLEIYYTIMYYFCYPSNLRIQEAWNPDDCVHNVLSLVKKPFRVAFSRIMLTQGLMEVVTTITQLSSLMIQGVYVIGIIVKYKRLRIRYTLYGNGMKDESWRHR